MADHFPLSYCHFISIFNQPLSLIHISTLDEFVGQEEIVGKGRLLRRAIEADQLSSIIFWGPPGCGKTTLAEIIANTTGDNFRTLSAVSSGIGDIREMVKFAKDELKFYGRRTVLFIDEIHRFNKTQQDALLPAVEDGTIILIGATTENPYFEVNSALISRSRIFRLKAVSYTHLLSSAKIEDPYEIIQEFMGKDLEYITYKHPLYDRISPLILGTHVTLDAGTGCVHTAPGHGADDFIVGKKYGLEIYSPLDDKGRLDETTGPFAGMPTTEANKAVSQA